MKPSLLLFIFLGLLFLSSFYLGALEIEFNGGVNNMTFHPDRVTAHSESTNFYQFQAFPYGFGNLHFRADLNGNMGLNIHASRDNILRNSLTAMITTNSDYFNVEFGPFIGMDDNWGKPDLGITGGLQIAFPGIAFFNLRGSTSLGTQHDFTGSHFRETTELRLGFWLPNVIMFGSVNTKNFTRELEDLTVINDELLRFQAGVELFFKGLPVMFKINAGYEIITRSYKRTAKAADELSALFAGAQIDWQINNSLNLTAGFEIPVIVNATEPMTAPDDSIFNLFKLHAGIRYRFR